MANKRTTTVTHPDGTVSKRTSTTRTYTHAVVASPVDPEVYAAHQESLAADLEQQAEVLRAAVAKGPKQVWLRDRGFRRGAADPDEGYRGEHSYHNFEAYLHGTTVSHWADSKGVAAVVNPGDLEVLGTDGNWSLVNVAPYLLLVATEAADRKQEIAAKMRAQAAAVRSGDLSGIRKSDLRWGVLRWSSSAALAHKAASGSEFAWARDEGSTVTVVEVDQ